MVHMDHARYGRARPGKDGACGMSGTIPREFMPLAPLSVRVFIPAGRAELKTHRERSQFPVDANAESGRVDLFSGGQRSSICSRQQSRGKPERIDSEHAAPVRWCLLQAGEACPRRPPHARAERGRRPTTIRHGRSGDRQRRVAVLQRYGPMDAGEKLFHLNAALAGGDALLAVQITPTLVFHSRPAPVQCMAYAIVAVGMTAASLAAGLPASNSSSSLVWGCSRRKRMPSWIRVWPGAAQPNPELPRVTWQSRSGSRPRA